MIVAANVFDVRMFKQTKRMGDCRKIKADPWRERTFAEQETALICVLEMDSAVLTVSGKSLDLCNKCITFYIDNNAAKCGLIKADSNVQILAILARIFWAIAAYRNIAPG